MYKLITTDREATRLARDLEKVKLLPFDSETDCTVDGFAWTKEKQILWQFHYKKVTYLVDLRFVNPQIFKKVLEDPNIKKLIHNSAFDAAWTAWEHDIWIVNIGDTRLNENLVLGTNWPRQPPAGWKKPEFDALKPQWSASLEFCLERRGLPAKLEFIPQYWWAQVIEAKPKGSKKDAPHIHIPLEEWDQAAKDKYSVIRQYSLEGTYYKFTEKQLEYYCRDVEHLEEIYLDQEKFLRANDMADLMELESRVAKITYQMMCRGFTIDTVGWLRYARENEKIYEEAMTELQALVPEVANWAAPGQISKFFGVQYIAEARELDTSYLDKRRQKAHELWMTANSVQKLTNTYGTNWVLRHVGMDSKVHCQYTQIINTGRYSADSPNLQNIPVFIKRGKGTATTISPTRQREFFIPPPRMAVRRAHNQFEFVSTKRKRKFVVADFKSQELAIIAIGSGEESWLQCLREGRDLHGMVAAMMFTGWNEMSKDEQKLRRRQAKDINFGIAYGLGAPGLDEKLNIGVEECQELLNLFNRTFRKIAAWLRQNGDFCVRTGTSFSFPPFNRMRVVTQLDGEDWRRKNIGKNNPVQATGADMSKLAMVYMDDEKLDMIHMNHDELIVECWEDEAESVKERMAKCMTDAAIAILDEALTTPDIHIVDNWMEAKAA